MVISLTSRAALFEVEVPVIEAVPAAIGVTTPLASTVAIEVLLLDQVTPVAATEGVTALVKVRL